MFDGNIDAITKIVDRFLRRLLFIPSRTYKKSVDTEKKLFDNIYILHGFPEAIVPDWYYILGVLPLDKAVRTRP